jgi:CubicO group peptidase (beta-lactamase class C family)
MAEQIHGVHGSLDALRAALEQRIPERMAKAKVVGLAVALVHTSEGESDPVVWQRGFGLTDAEPGEPVTPETVFQAASLSKPAFAYAVLVASRDGLLDLDTPLSAYLPGPYIPDEPRLNQITARHVLSHTPGFPNWRPKEQPLRIHFAAGERFAYSGEGFVYLQRVVEHLSRQPLDAWMRSRLLDPLGMRRSSYVWVDAYEGRAARGHDEEGKPTEIRRIREPNAAYSLCTTPSEYAHLVGVMLQPPDGPAYLAADQVTDMLTPQVPVNDAGLDAERPTSEVRTSERVSWGLGWGLQHAPATEAFWHWGDNGDYQAFAMGSRQLGLGMVCMANCKSGRRLWDDLFGLAFGAELPAVAWLYSLYGEISEK